MVEQTQNFFFNFAIDRTSSVYYRCVIPSIVFLLLHEAILSQSEVLAAPETIGVVKRRAYLVIVFAVGVAIVHTGTCNYACNAGRITKHKREGENTKRA